MLPVLKSGNLDLVATQFTQTQNNQRANLITQARNSISPDRRPAVELDTNRRAQGDFAYR